MTARIVPGGGAWTVMALSPEGGWYFDSEHTVHQDAVDRWWKLLHPRSSARSSHGPEPAAP